MFIIVKTTRMCVRRVLGNDAKLHIKSSIREDESEELQRSTLTTTGVTSGIRTSREKFEDEKTCCGLIPDAHSPGSGEMFSRDLVEEQEAADHGRKYCNRRHQTPDGTTQEKRTVVYNPTVQKSIQKCQVSISSYFLEADAEYGISRLLLRPMAVNRRTVATGNSTMSGSDSCSCRQVKQVVKQQKKNSF